MKIVTINSKKIAVQLDTKILGELIEIENVVEKIGQFGNITKYRLASVNDKSVIYLDLQEDYRKFGEFNDKVALEYAKSVSTNIYLNFLNKLIPNKSNKFFNFQDYINKIDIENFVKAKVEQFFIESIERDRVQGKTNQEIINMYTSSSSDAFNFLINYIVEEYQNMYKNDVLTKLNKEDINFNIIKKIYNNVYFIINDLNTKENWIELQQKILQQLR